MNSSLNLIHHWMLAVSLFFAVTTSSVLTQTLSPSGELNSILETDDGQKTGKSFHGIQIRPDLDLQLFAREPMVQDPVAICFDANGWAYVVEMRDYPYGLGPDRSPMGTIRLLKDTDWDGDADESILFAEGLSFPTSITPWKGGVLVSAPPEVIFLKDEDGDGRADIRRVVLRGFKLGVTDSNVNGLQFHFDNTIHGANGGNGGSIQWVSENGDSSPTLPLRGADFRFHPETGILDRTTHTGGGFGLVFDDWGHSFTTYNIDYLQQRILPLRYLENTSGLPPVQGTVNISIHGEMARIYPISTPETRVNHPEQAGHFSSAGGMGWISEGSIFPKSMWNSVFVCDVVSNLAHRDLVAPEGSIFQARRAADEMNREFLASRDNWFRPVGLPVGPDGALYLIDMQRAVIEHPDYIPETVRQRINIRAGEQRGRIYRITPKNMAPLKGSPGLAEAAPAVWVEALQSINPWRRLTAQRLLIENQSHQVTPLLKAQVHSEFTNPFGKLHSAWTLQGLDELGADEALALMQSSHPGLRENGFRLSEPWLNQNTADGLAIRRALFHFIPGSDGDAAQLQAILSAGTIDALSVEESSALEQALWRNREDRWMRLAVYTALKDTLWTSLMQALRELRSTPEAQTDPTLEWIRECVAISTARMEEADIIQATSGSDWVKFWTQLSVSDPLEPFQLAALEGAEAGLVRSDKVAETLRGSLWFQKALDRMAAHASVKKQTQILSLRKAIGLPVGAELKQALIRAEMVARDATALLETRIEQIQMLGLADFEQAESALFELLDGKEPGLVQQAALKALSHFENPEVGERLIQRWNQLTPTVRVPLVQWLISQRAFHSALLDAIESGEIALGELNLDLEQRRTLRRWSSPETQERASKLFGDEEYSGRSETVERWLADLPSSGNAANGRILFTERCAICHKADGIGQKVGPDLSDLSYQSAEDLASNILDPNMAINPNYISLMVETDDGRLIQGILEAETAEALTLVQAGGEKLTVNRDELIQIETTGRSLMPEGLEAGWSPQDLRDLIEFLQTPPRIGEP